MPAINRAFEGVDGANGIGGIAALHLCFGYAAVVSDKPGRYSYLTELEEAHVQHISIESAQPNLDLAVLGEFATKTIVLGVLDLGNPEIEPPEAIAARIRQALNYIPPERLMIAPDCGMKYLPRNVDWRKLKAMTLGAAIVRDFLTG